MMGLSLGRCRTKLIDDCGYNWLFAREAMEAIGKFALIAVRYLDSAMSIARKGSDGLRIRLKYCLFV